MEQITIEITYALPHQYFLKTLKVDMGSTVQDAILKSGILQQYKEIDLKENKIGVFSRPVKLTDVLNQGDRIEIYRPLLADPKEIRRKRAEQQQREQAAQKRAEDAIKAAEKAAIKVARKNAKSLQGE